MEALRLACFLAVFSLLPRSSDAEMLQLRTPARALSSLDPGLQRSLETASADRSSAGDLDRFEMLLSPIFESLPKNGNGRLDKDSMQYALRRVLSEESGFTISGVQELLLDPFNERHGDRGGSLADLASMAEAAEQMIYVEARWALESLYKLKGISLDSVLRGLQLEHILELYTVSFLQGHAVSLNDATSIRDTEDFQANYAAWPEVRDILYQAQLDTGLEKFAFEDVMNIIKVSTASLVQLHHQECQTMGDLLADLEERQSGKLPVSDFQQMAMLEGKSLFSESVTELLRGGALDFTDVSTPRLIIPNYMASKSNCIARSSLFSLCCPDACSGILSHIEDAIGKDMATPIEIASVVEDLPVPVVGLDDGLLSPALLRKLQDVAKLQGGRVSLHGEAFAEWLHMLHPRACALPYSEASIQAAEAAMAASAATGREKERAADRLAAEEELFVSRPSAQLGHHTEVAPTAEGATVSTTVNLFVSGLAVVAIAMIAVARGVGFSAGASRRKLS